MPGLFEGLEEEVRKICRDETYAIRKEASVATANLGLTCKEKYEYLEEQLTRLDTIVKRLVEGRAITKPREFTFDYSTWQRGERAWLFDFYHDEEIKFHKFLEVPEGPNYSWRTSTGGVVITFRDGRKDPRMAYPCVWPHRPTLVIYRPEEKDGCRK